MSLDIFGFAKNNVFLAPLAGITDIAFRQVCAEYGAGLTYTEMISAKGVKYQNKNTLELLRVSKAEKKAAVQLFGREPLLMAQTAKYLEQTYPDTIAFFDINMGCPAPKIVNNGEGSALMKEPKTAYDIVYAIKKEAALPVTVKFRKGFDEKNINALEFAHILEDAGADALTIHGRTRSQYYEGKADWDIIAKVKSSVKIPVIANGDVFCPEDAKNILSYTGADGVMVARGALGNPRIFKMIDEYFKMGTYSAPTDEQKIEDALYQARLACEYKGEYVAVREMRKHVCWYLKGMRGSAKIKNDVVKATTLNELAEILKRLC